MSQHDDPTPTDDGLQWPRWDDGEGGAVCFGDVFPWDEPKRSLPADGLLASAFTYCHREQSDGYVPVAALLDDVVEEDVAAFRGLLAELVEHGDLEPLPPGARRAVAGRAHPAVRSLPILAAVGPFGGSGYVVRRYLDFNLSRAESQSD